MNKFPYNSGHLMIVPFRQVRSIQKLSADEMLEIMELIRLSVSVLEKAMKPHGFNIGANLGRVAGAGINDHIHFHVVPRWNGDTNFMPTLGDVKLISQDMMKSWKTLKQTFKQSGKK